MRAGCGASAGWVPDQAPPPKVPDIVADTKVVDIPIDPDVRERREGGDEADAADALPAEKDWAKEHLISTKSACRSLHGCPQSASCSPILRACTKIAGRSAAPCTAAHEVPFFSRIVCMHQQCGALCRPLHGCPQCARVFTPMLCAC